LSPPLFDAVVLDFNGLLTSWGFYAALAVAYLVFRWSGDGGGGDDTLDGGDGGGE
jgi:hypothetical protein